ncbi:MAG: DPP IV N-terminal domain-containing protein [Caldilineaceae bacterium]
MSHRSMLCNAAEIQTAEARATPYTGTGTPRPSPTYTPYPPNWIEPIIVTQTPTPLNAATAEWIRQVKAAEAIVYGTPTATPPWVWTATSTPLPTATSYFIDVNELTPTPTLTPTPEGVPAFLSGKIMFYSDRTGSNRLWLMDPDGSNLALWQGDSWIYDRAKEEDTISPDGVRRLAVQREQVTVPQIFILAPDGGRQQVTYFKVVSYDPAWSPVGDSLLFVSAESGNDEIYRIQADGSGLQQLTQNDWEWDKHPSWSPDGQQIVFFSNRTGMNQLFVMNADGSNVRRISDDVSNDAYPVWIK